MSTLTPSEDDCEEDRKCMRGEGALVTDDMDDDCQNDCTWGMTKMEEVTENICEPVDAMRRQECEVTLPPSVNECVVDDLEAPTENECVWGVRGWCKTHKIYGKKYTTTSKDWKKKKDGTFGWTYRKKTNYTCTGVRGVGDNSSPALITLGTSHASITARISGVEKQTSGQHLSGLVGGDYRAISEYESAV